MRLFTVLALTGLLVPGTTDAASCKIDGVWYDYDSPQCSPQSDNGPAEPEPPPPVKQPLPDSPSSSMPPIPSGAAAYLRPWNEVAPAALERCKKIEHPAMVDSCRRKEEMAYWAMHGNFDMPPNEAARAKTLCLSKTGSFEGQSGCMQEESRGYSDFNRDRGMPVAYASKARSECSQQYESWSIRSSCMISAKDRYEKGPKSRSVRPPNAKVFSSTSVYEHQPPPGYSRQSGTFSFTVNPELDEVRSVALEPTIPQPMHISRRAYLIGVRSEDYPDFEAFEEAVEARSSTVLFSPARPFIDGVGNLSFSSARFVNPGRNLATLLSEDEAKVFLHLDVEKGRSYLVDFIVKSHVPGSYRLKVKSDVRDIEDLGGAFNHVIAIVTAEGAGATHISLSQSSGNSFELHAVQVTSFAP